MKNKTQILIIGGGMTFKNRKDYLHYLKTRSIAMGEKTSWSGEYFKKSLGKNFEITRPRMPLEDDAKYGDWKVCFERYIPYLRNNVILIGKSLGGIFLAQYLSENKFPKKILATYLICAPFDDTCIGEDLFKLKKDLSLLEKNSKNLTLMFSKDDDCIPVDHAEKYRSKLKNAKIIIYKSKNGHFKITKFPEIVKMIKNDVKKK
jgi:predicted alpha/beta hydrolase family esterase